MATGAFFFGFLMGNWIENKDVPDHPDAIGEKTKFPFFLTALATNVLCLFISIYLWMLQVKTVKAEREGKAAAEEDEASDSESDDEASASTTDEATGRRKNNE